MHPDQLPYRTLTDALRSGSPPLRTLQDWLRNHPSEQTWLETLRSPLPGPIPQVSTPDLWRLYALGRVIQLVTDRPTADDTPLRALAAGLQLDLTEPETYHPFDHEVVSVESGPPGVVEIIGFRWPRVMLGPLLVQRAGVRVRAGEDRLHPERTTESTLYWAWRRASRPTLDPSHGWGSNSQWRTSFRRDYRLDTALHLNVDGNLDLGGAWPPSPRGDVDLDGPQALTREERVEILLYRCAVHCDKPSEDLFPFNDRLVLPVAA